MACTAARPPSAQACTASRALERALCQRGITASCAARRRPRIPEASSIVRATPSQQPLHSVVRIPTAAMFCSAAAEAPSIASAASLERSCAAPMAPHRRPTDFDQASATPATCKPKLVLRFSALSVASPAEVAWRTTLSKLLLTSSAPAPNSTPRLSSSLATVLVMASSARALRCSCAAWRLATRSRFDANSALEASRAAATVAVSACNSSRCFVKIPAISCSAARCSCSSAIWPAMFSRVTANDFTAAAKASTRETDASSSPPFTASPALPAR
mmetsp:Transcript_52353/g.111972  ORF Transcript_52353/g.111972 Transcript_52353/m.111972 type:complete len:274 (+) Transcript_52353:622-1443(+)